MHMPEEVTSHTITVEGLHTHYLEVGVGPCVVLLHSGEYGASAETSWGQIMAPIAAAGYRVIAPDWLGFGKSDKIVDFADPAGRRLRHMSATLRVLDAGKPALVGSSMGGSYLAKDLASENPMLPATAAVLTSGGGFIPDNDARRSILEYDLTVDGMRRILGTLLYNHSLLETEGYVEWRHQISLEPGAWQCAASARLRPPTPGTDSSADEVFGKPDTVAYEKIRVPTLVVAGADDPLRLPGYADELAARIPDSELRLYDRCGHMPNLEYPEQYTADLIDFLNRNYRPWHKPQEGAAPAKQRVVSETAGRQ